MKTKGFTLIELLAVIVILAIIALIATPIILNIINDSRNSSVIRSAENYSSAIEQAIARKNLIKEFNPISCEVMTEETKIENYEKGDLICDSEPLKIEIDGDKPNSGNIVINKGEIIAGSLVFGTKSLSYNNGWNYGDICYGYEKEMTYTINYDACMESEISDEDLCRGVGTKDDVESIAWYVDNGYQFELEEMGIIDLTYKETTNCIANSLYNKTTSTTVTKGNIPTGEFNPGDEYIISPDNTNAYHFYVLGSNDDYVTLISSPFSLMTPWITQEEYNDDNNWGDEGNSNKGPITAMNVLYNQTKNWTNVENITLNYRDENIMESQIEGSCEYMEVMGMKFPVNCSYDLIEGNHESGYNGIYTNGNITEIKSKEQLTVSTFNNLKSRLPMVSELKELGCIKEDNSCPSWIPTNIWTLASSGDYLSNAYYIGSDFSLDKTSISEPYLGLSAVVVVKKSKLLEAK